MLKKLITTLAVCAFGQQDTATTTQPAGQRAQTAMAKETAIEATVTNFTPGEKLVVRKAGEAPSTFTISKTMRVENKKGEEIGVTRLKEGMRVHIYVSGPEDNRLVERVVIDQE
jgi:hypothetical protein